MKISNPALVKKLKSRCKISEEECWVWNQCKQASGYGRVRMNGKTHYAHRLMYEAVHGKIPEGADVYQTCDDRACINPDHLKSGTRKDTMANCRKKGNVACGMALSLKRRGEKASRSKLTQQQVDQIRVRFSEGEAKEDLAKEFSVSPDNIYRIVNFHTWRTGFYSSMPAKRSA